MSIKINTQYNKRFMCASFGRPTRKELCSLLTA